MPLDGSTVLDFHRQKSSEFFVASSYWCLCRHIWSTEVYAFRIKHVNANDARKGKEKIPKVSKAVENERKKNRKSCFGYSSIIKKYFLSVKHQKNCHSLNASVAKYIFHTRSIVTNSFLYTDTRLLFRCLFSC